MSQLLALSLGNQVEKIGSYLGFAAIPGVAILALLFFAQAREVKRLREWAGRAPERDQELQNRIAAQGTAPAPPAAAAQTQAGKRVVAQPIPGRGQAVATPAATAAAAAAAQQAKAAKPAAAPGQPVKPAATPGQPAKPAQPAVAPGQAAKPGQPATVPGQPAKPAAAPGQPVKPGQPAAAPAVATAAPAAPAKPGAPATAVLPATAAAAATPAAAAPLRAGSPSATLPPRTPPPGARPATAPADEPPSHRNRNRNRMLALAAVLVVGAGVVLAATQLGGGDNEPSANRVGQAPNTKSSASNTSNGQSGPVARDKTTVAVLNGTTVPGLAAQVSDELDRFGFKRGAVTNAADQQKPATVVQYASGQKKAGQAVAEILRIKKVEPLDANTQAIAGPEAVVVVTVGADKTQ